jgi:hypothetical protein
LREEQWRIQRRNKRQNEGGTREERGRNEGGTREERGRNNGGTREVRYHVDIFDPLHLLIILQHVIFYFLILGTAGLV